MPQLILAVGLLVLVSVLILVSIFGPNRSIRERALVVAGTLVRVLAGGLTA